MRASEIVILRQDTQAQLAEANTTIAALEEAIATGTGREAAKLALRDALHSEYVEAKERADAALRSEQERYGLIDQAEYRPDPVVEAASARFIQASGELDDLHRLVLNQERALAHWRHVRDGCEERLTMLDREEAALSESAPEPSLRERLAAAAQRVGVAS
jgi:hypothetical protein